MASSSAEALEKRKRALALAPLILLMLLWLWLLPSLGAFRAGPNIENFGEDFAIVYAGALVTHEGGSPYDPVANIRALNTLRGSFDPVKVTPVTEQFVRNGGPPLFYWALQPLTRWPFPAVALYWIAAMYLLAGAGFVAVLMFFGWTRRVVPTLMFLAMPQVVMGAYVGNVNGVLFAAAAGGLLASRRYPVLAGMVLSLTWVKPQLAFVAVMFIVFFHAPRPLRVIAGYGAATVAMLAATLATTGPESLALWWNNLVGYPAVMTGVRDVATLSAMYSQALGSAARLATEALTLLAVLAPTAWLWWRFRWTTGSPVAVQTVGWLWALWFIALPYAHSHDEKLLAIPVIAALGTNGVRVFSLAGLVAVYAVFLTVVPLAVHPPGISLLTVPLVAVAIALFVLARSPAPAPLPERYRQRPGYLTGDA